MGRSQVVVFVSLLLVILLFAPLVMKVTMLPALGLVLSGALRI